MATNGQFSWPSVGSSVAAYGQFGMAANIAPLNPGAPRVVKLERPSRIGASFEFERHPWTSRSNAPGAQRGGPRDPFEQRLSHLSLEPDALRRRELRGD